MECKLHRGSYYAEQIMLGESAHCDRLRLGDTAGLGWDGPVPSAQMAATAPLAANRRTHESTALPRLLLTEATNNYIS